MIARRLHRLGLSLAALLVAALGAVSAGELAPDRDALARAAALAAIGAQPGDICGTEHEHAAPCPLCHLLSEPPSPAPAETLTAWRGGFDLVLPPAMVRTAVVAGPALGPRAPPVSL